MERFVAPTGVSSLDGLVRRGQRKNDARFKLLDLHGVRELVTLFEQLESRADIAAAELECRRERLRQQYRQLIGVEIELRDVLRERLQSAATTGEETVSQIIADIRTSYRKGWTSVSGGFVTPVEGES